MVVTRRAYRLMSLAVKTSRPHFWYVFWAFPFIAKALKGQAFGSRFLQRAPTIPQSLTQPAKLSKSLYNPTFPSIFVQNLYQLRHLTYLTVFFSNIHLYL